MLEFGKVREGRTVKEIPLLNGELAESYSEPKYWKPDDIGDERHDLGQGELGSAFGTVFSSLSFCQRNRKEQVGNK